MKYKDKDVPYFYKWRVISRFSGSGQISGPGCMGEQQAKLATSLVDTRQR